MRKEKDIRAGLKEAEELIIDSANDMQKAIKNKDWVEVYRTCCDVMVASLAITAIEDACFGQDNAKPEIVVPEFIKNWNKHTR